MASASMLTTAIPDMEHLGLGSLSDKVSVGVEGYTIGSHGLSIHLLDTVDVLRTVVTRPLLKSVKILEVGSYSLKARDGVGG